MSRRSLASTAALAVGVIALLAQASAVGQTQSAAPKPTAAAKPSTPPRTADGKPDLQGIYTDNTVTPFQRPKELGSKEFYTEQEFAELMKRARQGDIGEEGNLGAANPQEVRYDLELYGFDRTKVRFGANKRTSLIIGPEGVVPPILPEAQKRNAERAARNKGHEFDSHENRPLSERCILLNQERIPLIPGANEGNLIQIVQGPGYVTILRETNHSTRVIPTDGRAACPAEHPLLSGRLGGALGREHAGRRHHEFHEPERFPGVRREAASGGTFHASRRRHADLSVHR